MFVAARMRNCSQVRGLLLAPVWECRALQLVPVALVRVGLCTAVTFQEVECTTVMPSICTSLLSSMSMA